MEKRYYTLEQRSDLTGYTVTVGSLTDNVRVFGEFERNNSDDDYAKCKWYESVDAAEDYIMSASNYYNMIKEKRVAYTLDDKEFYLENDMRRRGWVTPNEMNEQRDIDTLIENTKEFFSQHKDIEVADHGFDHAMRVYNKAKILMEDETTDPKVNKLVVACASILHDADDHKFFKTEDYANARDIMKKSGIKSDIIDKAVHCIDQVGFSKNKYNQPDCIEAGITRDADRIDAIGAFGIMRTFVYGASEGRPVHESIKHCSDKILHLHEHMCTEAGSKMANEIAKHGQDFMVALGKEYAMSDGVKSYGNNAVQVADNLVTRCEIKNAELEIAAKRVAEKAKSEEPKKSKLRSSLENKVNGISNSKKDEIPIGPILTVMKKGPNNPWGE